MKIKDNFKNLIPPLSDSEYEELEKSIICDGCRDALVIWNDILLDGHNRKKICDNHNIEYKTIEMTFSDDTEAEQWIIINQFGRRNLSPFQRAELALKLKPVISRKAKENQGSRTDICLMSDKCIDTKKELAKKAGVGHDTIAKAEFITKNADDTTKQKLRNGQTTINKEYKKIKREQNHQARQKKKSEFIEIPDDERAQFIVSDISDAHQHVEANSVDWIITDPPYPREYLETYSGLGQFAKHSLKEGGSLICMIGQSYLPEILNRLTEHLEYHWTLSYLVPGPGVQLFDRKVNTFWKPILWLTKGKYLGDWIGDVTKSQAPDKEHHHWGQSFDGMKDIMERFVYPAQLICDPFLGGGTTGAVAVELGCRFIGIDNDKECIKTSKTRILEFLSRRRDDDM